ncbi:transcription-repair coupling factor, partial [Edwardsiella tarda]
MSEQYRLTLPERYPLPARAGDVRQLGQLSGSACALECAEIAARHPGAVMLVVPDMQTALRLRDEIPQFSRQWVTTLADWET